MEIYKGIIHKDSEAGIGAGFLSYTKLNGEESKAYGLIMWFGHYCLTYYFKWYEKDNFFKRFHFGTGFATGVGG